MDITGPNALTAHHDSLLRCQRHMFLLLERQPLCEATVQLL